MELESVIRRVFLGSITFSLFGSWPGHHFNGAKKNGWPASNSLAQIKRLYVVTMTFPCFAWPKCTSHYLEDFDFCNYCENYHARNCCAFDETSQYTGHKDWRNKFLQLGYDNKPRMWK